MANRRYETIELQVPRATIDAARKQADIFRANAEEDYRRAQALASRWELAASLMEQGYTEEEAMRRALRPRIEQ